MTTWNSNPAISRPCLWYQRALTWCFPTVSSISQPINAGPLPKSTGFCAPGGRLIISDVVCDTEPPAALKNDDILRGECLAGALTQKDLFGLLHESGFTAIRARKRFPYRQVQGHQFYSLTYSAVKPEEAHVRSRSCTQVLWQVWLPNRVIYCRPDVSRSLELANLPADVNDLFILDSQGAVTNQNWDTPSCCPGEPGVLHSGSCSRPTLPCPVLLSAAPASRTLISPPPDRGQCRRLWITLTFATENREPKTANFPCGCLLCGAPLTYLNQEITARCVYCQTEHSANAICRDGHYICDACHSRDALAIIEHFLVTTRETDMLALLRETRRHPAISLHGPEHHSLVPGIILAAYRNLGGPVTPEMLQTASKPGENHRRRRLRLSGRLRRRSWRRRRLWSASWMPIR